MAVVLAVAHAVEPAWAAYMRLVVVVVDDTAAAAAVGVAGIVGQQSRTDLAEEAGEIAALEEDERIAHAAAAAVAVARLRSAW